VREGWLEVHSGIGTIVAKRALPRGEARQRLMDEKLEPLAVEAMSAGLSLDELQRALAECWAALDTTEPRA
jgi:DNA-binding transcriptional regulator YhcF (GntR family)